MTQHDNQIVMSVGEKTRVTITDQSIRLSYEEGNYRAGMEVGVTPYTDAEYLRRVITDFIDKTSKDLYKHPARGVKVQLIKQISHGNERYFYARMDYKPKPLDIVSTEIIYNKNLIRELEDNMTHPITID